jgi:PAS domain S-box-containing protein
MSEDKSKKRLPIELKKLRQRVADLEAGESQRRQVEEALRQSEEYSSTILNHSPNPMLVTNPDTSIRYVNPALEELTGYSLVKVIGQRAPYPWWIEETLDRIKTSLEAALRHGTKAKEELFQKKNGERFWVEVTATPVMVDGEMRYYLASWVDITERRRAEEALHLRAQLLNEATDSIIATDLHGNLIYMNEATCRTRGYSKEEMLNMNLKQLVPPHIASLVDKRLRRIKKEGTIVFDSEHLRQDGGVFPIETTARTVNLGDRTIILSVIRDITERKKAEEALRESEERYRALLELGERIGEAVVMLQDDERGIAMHVYASDEWSRITGYSKEKLYNMSMADLIHEPDREKALERHERRILGEVLPGLYETTIIRKDGTEVPVEATYAYSSYKGKPANVGYIRDISERKKMEEQLIVTDRLASIGELASGIAHELNNPLTGIIGFSELLLNKAIPEDVREDLQVINREAKRTSQVVKNLLTFARKHETTKQLVDINQAIKSVLDLRAYEQKVHNIAIVTNFDPELPEITADIFRLQQVFVNIIINAEYFMVQSHGRGTITITTKVKGNTILASFANDGPGIKKEHLRHLFDPFFTTKEVGKGTGLGLSICHGIVTEHGGQIHAESEPGKGATFIVELPIK